MPGTCGKNRDVSLTPPPPPPPSNLLSRDESWSGGLTGGFSPGTVLAVLTLTLRTALATAVCEESRARYPGGQITDGAPVALVSQECSHPAQIISVPAQAPQSFRILQEVPEVSVAGHRHHEPLQPGLGVDGGDVNLPPVAEDDVEGGGGGVAGPVQTEGHGVRAPSRDEADPEVWPGELSPPLIHLQLPVSGSPHQQSVEYLGRVSGDLRGGNISGEFTWENIPSPPTLMIPS